MTAHTRSCLLPALLVSLAVSLAIHLVAGIWSASAAMHTAPAPAAAAAVTSNDALAVAMHCYHAGRNGQLESTQGKCL